MTSLTEQAEALGIKVDGRWSDERLQSEIEKAGTPKAALVPVRLLYDCWFANDERTKAGTKMNVSVDEAKRLISNGKAERADPLPGDND